MEIGKKFELLMEKAVSFKLGALMLKPSRSVLVIYSTSAERPPPEPPPQAVMNIRIGWLLLRPSSTLQETEFGFSSLELGTERPPRKPPWVNFGWVGLASFELCFSICVLVVVFVCYLSCFVCCVLFLYLVDFKSLYHVSLLCWHHRSFIVLYEDEYRFPTFAIYQLFFVQNDKVKKSETKCSRNERDVVEKMIRNWIEKKTLDSHISFVRYRRWKLLMDWLLEYEIWLKSSYLSAKFLGIANHALGGIYNIPSYLSPGASDLITKLLEVDPMKRITILEIHQHPWFQISMPHYLAMPPPLDKVQQAKKLEGEEEEEEPQLDGLDCKNVFFYILSRLSLLLPQKLAKICSRCLDENFYTSPRVFSREDTNLLEFEKIHNGDNDSNMVTKTLEGKI